MDDLFDILRGLIPAAIALIWLLGRLGRRRKQGTPTDPAPKTRGAVSQAVQKGPDPERKLRIADKIRRLEQRISGKADDIPPSEDPIYKSLEKRRVGPAPQETLVSEGSQRMLETTREVEVEITSAVERITELPPLAQGLVWKMILDQAPGLEDPPG